MLFECFSSCYCKSPVCLTSFSDPTFSTAPRQEMAERSPKDPSSVTYSSSEKPLELLRGDSCISRGQAPNECQLGSPSIPECSCFHSSLIILPVLHLTCPTNQSQKSLLEPCFLPILNPSVKLLENQLNSVASFYMK